MSDEPERFEGPDGEQANLVELLRRQVRELGHKHADARRTSIV